MKQENRIEQSLGLRQRLLPQQVQYVRFLEMTSAEVDEEVHRALDENPALTLAEPAGEEAFAETADQLQRADYGSDDDVPTWQLRASGGEGSGDGAWQAMAADADETLAQHLEQQLAERALSPAVQAVARYMIGNIDDNGYLTRTLSQIADDIAISTGADVPGEVLRAAYDMVRSLDPAGVGALDLRDCLLLQLPSTDEATEAQRLATRILHDYYEQFSHKHFDKIALATGVSEEQLRQALEVIKRLDPKPGARIGYSAVDEAAKCIVPEFTVEVTDGDTLNVGLAWQPPELAIDATFALKDMPPDANERMRQAYLFVKQRHDEGVQLMRLLDMRRDTMLRVIGAIATLQRDFFLTDDTAKIRPMVLRDIAAMTGLDISVISRVTSGKYLQARSGVYPLKMFFNEKPTHGAADAEAADDTNIYAILKALREIIEGEDKRHPLADVALQGALAARGLDIARRTVSKYRERLGFPVARLRKEL